jgi:ABC-type multidrug transport system fused ATPase/permease subunit
LGAEASQTIHFNMAKKVLRAPLNYFESTPVGRLIQRFTKDLDQIDQQLPGSFSQLIASTLNIFASMIAIVIVTPSFSLVLGPLLLVYFAITNYYRGVARELKRLDSISRSPVFAHFSETIGGLSTIRSFSRQDMVRSTNEVRLEGNLAAYYALKVVDRWLSVRLELLGNIIVFVSALLAVWSGSRAGPAGLSLNNALSTTSLLNWAVRNGAETESLMNSVERVLYTTTNTPSEAPSVIEEFNSSTTPAPALGNYQPKSDAELLNSGWPWQGGVSFRNVVMRYRDDFQPVLQGVNVDINPGESIGIVGRTGSGKSSLFRALLRLTELEHGTITIDGVDIRTIGLDTLRSQISIIPQDPVLFSGSVRCVELASMIHLSQLP